MEENQVQETGIERLARVRKEAATHGIKGVYTADEFEALIAQAKAGTLPADKVETKVGLTPDEAAKIDAEMQYRFNAEEKIRGQRRIQTEMAGIVAESESLGIEVDLPENPTELHLAKARVKLGSEKVQVRPSPETVAIEASKRGYYKFMNLEQRDASHSANLGGKYHINLIAGQIHVLSEYHVKKWDQIAVTPVYESVKTGIEAGPNTVSKFSYESRKVRGETRWVFKYLGEAPQDAPFGLVTDMKILNELRQPV